MAWTAEDSFDDYSDGNLNGNGSSGDGWAGAWSSSNIVVQSTTKLGSSGKAVEPSSTLNFTADRSLTALSSGKLYYAFRVDAKASGDGLVFRLFDGSATSVVGPRTRCYDDSGTLRFQIRESVAWTSIFIPSLDTWYICEIDFDVSTDTFDFRWKASGGTWSTVENYDFQTSTGDIDGIRLNGDHSTGWEGFYDAISATDPDTPSTGFAFSQAVIIS